MRKRREECGRRVFSNPTELTSFSLKKLSVRAVGKGGGGGEKGTERKRWKKVGR